jgi:hypothetical protein
MPNGFYGSNHDWDRMEAPLLKMDAILASFAALHGLTGRANYHDWPERSLLWSSNRIRKLIQIYLEDEKGPTFNFWISASEDRGPERFWKQQFLKKAAPIQEIERDLPQLLSTAKETLDTWTSGDLEFATALKRGKT